jgi:hypothetical protein
MLRYAWRHPISNQSSSTRSPGARAGLNQRDMTRARALFLLAVSRSRGLEMPHASVEPTHTLIDVIGQAQFCLRESGDRIAPLPKEELEPARLRLPARQVRTSVRRPFVPELNSLDSRIKTGTQSLPVGQ